MLGIGIANFIYQLMVSTTVSTWNAHIFYFYLLASMFYEKSAIFILYIVRWLVCLKLFRIRSVWFRMYFNLRWFWCPQTILLNRLNRLISCDFWCVLRCFCSALRFAWTLHIAPDSEAPRRFCRWAVFEKKITRYKLQAQDTYKFIAIYLVFPVWAATITWLSKATVMSELPRSK